MINVVFHCNPLVAIVNSSYPTHCDMATFSNTVSIADAALSILSELIIEWNGSEFSFDIGWLMADGIIREGDVHRIWRSG